MPKHLYLQTMALLLASAAMAQVPQTANGPSGIVAVRENGRTVYVNDDSPRPAAVSPPRSAIRHSVLVYWSRTEKRWIPVPAPSPWAMRAARSAAAEVTQYIAARPSTAQSAASSNPNYRQAARGRAVTAAELDKVIEEAARRNSVDPNLVRAIIKVESNFNPAAVSRKGALGLMQLMPDTARRLGVSDAFDPAQNVEAGTRHLRNLLNSYHGDVTLSLAAYNAGSGAVDRNNGVPPYSETRDYVKRITDIYGGNGGGTRLFMSVRSPIRMVRSPGGTLTITNE